MYAERQTARFGRRLVRSMYRARYQYLLLLPGLIFFVIFCYIPIYGLTLAFKEYNASLGILRSPFIGWLNFKYLFREPAFWNALSNTLKISFCRILFQFPFPILLALMLNELSSRRTSKVLQTVFTFPHFLSWLVIGGIFINLLGDQGTVNTFLHSIGQERVQILSRSQYFIPLLYLSEIWKSSGWECIIYLAAIASIDTQQYEAAIIDGANRFHKLIYITLPGIKSTIVILLILAFGNVMNAGFDQIFNLGNAAVREASEILDTYIYRITFKGSSDFGFSTAVGLFRSVANFVFLIVCDRIAKLIGENGLFY